jgi:hypothetical protein
MAAIDNAIKHFKEKYEKKSFEVPEWGDGNKALTIYIEPFTLKQQQEVRKVFNNKGEGEGLAYLISLKSLDAQDNRIFWGEHLKLLNQADPSVIADVAVKIWNLGLGKELDEIAFGEEEEEFRAVEKIKKN